MKKIAICNQKGGVGKTTTAITLGAALVKKGHKVLLIDCDDSLDPTLTTSLVSDDPDSLPSTLVNMLLFTAMKTPIDIGAELDKAVVHHAEGYDILPTSLQLTGLTSYLNGLTDEELKIKCLAKVLKQIDGRYDFVILDTAPSLNTLSMNVMAAADEVIIVTQAQGASERGIEPLLNTIRRCKSTFNPTIKVAGILITMFHSRTNYSKGMVRKIREKYSDLSLKVFRNMIPRGTNGEEFVDSGSSLLKYMPRSNVTKAYLDFVDEYLEGMEG